ncbi:MAG: hypothetical protein ABIP74_02445 [Candidatus Saccharimonas sp.]
MKRFASPFDSLPARAHTRRITSHDDIPQSLADIDSLGTSVVDLIPPSERSRHAYLRGASLGAVAYNLLHYDMLNTAQDIDNPNMHFADGPERYAYADSVARSIAQGEGYADIQYLPEMRRFLADTSGTPADTTPGIVFGLHPDFNDYALRNSDRGAGEGVIWDGAVTLDMIDRHSREALEKLLSDSD